LSYTAGGGQLECGVPLFDGRGGILLAGEAVVYLWIRCVVDAGCVVEQKRILAFHTPMNMWRVLVGGPAFSPQTDYGMSDATYQTVLVLCSCCAMTHLYHVLMLYTSP
jgi:hypothetical protein